MCVFGKGGGGGVSLRPNVQKGWEFERISIFKGRLLGKRGLLFSGGLHFYIKSKLKSEIFNDKKIL